MIQTPCVLLTLQYITTFMVPVYSMIQSLKYTTQVFNFLEKLAFHGSFFFKWFGLEAFVAGPYTSQDLNRMDTVKFHVAVYFFETLLSYLAWCYLYIDTNHVTLLKKVVWLRLTWDCCLTLMCHIVSDLYNIYFILYVSNNVRWAFLQKLWCI